MARIEGIDPRRAPFLMRQVFKSVRKMVGRDLTPQKIQARVPRLFWFSTLGMWLLEPESKDPASAASTGHIADRCASWLPVLNRRQFCRRQDVRLDR